MPFIFIPFSLWFLICLIPFCFREDSGYLGPRFLGIVCIIRPDCGCWWYDGTITFALLSVEETRKFYSDFLLIYIQNLNWEELFVGDSMLFLRRTLACELWMALIVVRYGWSAGKGDWKGEEIEARGLRRGKREGGRYCFGLFDEGRRKKCVYILSRKETLWLDGLGRLGFWFVR